MKTLLAILLTGLFLMTGPAPSAGADDDKRQTVMVELFTSQGCSSCPPADRNLSTLAAREDVLVLSMHVDYWDYLGWRDTFSRPENTRRQFWYRDVMGARVVYTPQAVVHGRYDVPGGRMDALEEAIEKARDHPKPVMLGISGRGGMLNASIGAAPAIEPCTLWIAAYDREATVEVHRGENAGKRLTYHNVVSKLMRVGRWDGTSRSFDLPQPGKGEGVAVWLQDDRTGHILAVAFVEN